jgi:hypothetical protein
MSSSAKKKKKKKKAFLKNWPQQGPVAEGHRQKSGARSAPDF